MAGFSRRLRQLATRAALMAGAAFALVPSADAQWLPFAPAPPREIAQRLQAEGYVLVGPLRRRDTVYLADVAGGPFGRERLVIDAWSGEILQRFAERRGGFVPEGGEFSGPPPLGPPPPQDFREGNYGYGPGGPGGFEPPPGRPPRAKPRSRSTATARKEVKPTTPAEQHVAPLNAGTGSPAAGPSEAPAAAPAPAATAAPATGASPPPANPGASGPAQPEPSPNAAAEPAKEAQPKLDAGPSAPAEAKQARPPSPAPASSAAEKPSEKKVNDLPVNPLD